MPRLLLLGLEFSSIFVAVPLLVYGRVVPNAPIPYLVVAGVCAFAFLRHDPRFDQSRLFSWGHAAPFLLPLLLRDALFLSFLGAAVWRFAPHLLFSLVRRAKKGDAAQIARQRLPGRTGKGHHEGAAAEETEPRVPRKTGGIDQT